MTIVTCIIGSDRFYLADGSGEPVFFPSGHNVWLAHHKSLWFNADRAPRRDRTGSMSGPDVREGMRIPENSRPLYPLDVGWVQELSKLVHDDGRVIPLTVTPEMGVAFQQRLELNERPRFKCLPEHTLTHN